MFASPSPHTLLLVDDNPVNLQLISQIIALDLPTVQVLTAANARQGLTLAAEYQIDGAFIDVQMPGMDGLEMCRQLRLNPRTTRIPLVLMTAHIASPQLRAEGLEVGAHDFISKPISNVEMLARIKVMLRLCDNERAQATSTAHFQQLLEGHSAQVRWLSGLLISGDGSLAVTDEQWLRQLAVDLHHTNSKDNCFFYEKLISDFPLPWRRTLLKLSLLESIPLALARMLSEIADIAAGLDYLKRHQLSLVQIEGKEDCLLFNPQIKKLLRSKAQQMLSDAERLEVYQIAADWYRERGQLLQLLACLIGGVQYEKVSQLLSQHGLELLHLDNACTSIKVLDQIDDDTVAGCGWLSLLRGIMRLHQLAEDTALWLELAYQLFASKNNARGMALAQSWQVLQTIYVDGNRGDWSSRFDTFARLTDTVMPTLAIDEQLTVAFALGLSQLCFAGELGAAQALLDPALAQAQQNGSTLPFARLQLLRMRLALYQGRILVARTAFEQAFSGVTAHYSCFDLLMIHQAAFDLLLITGSLSGLRRQQAFLISDCPLQVQRRILIDPLYDYYTANLLVAHNRLGLAEQLIDSALISPRGVNSDQMRSLLLQFRGWIRARSGSNSDAHADLEKGLELCRPAEGMMGQLDNLLLAGATCVALDQLSRAHRFFADALSASQQLGEERLRIGLHAWLGVVCRRLGQETAANDHLHAFYDLLRRQRTRFFCGLTPDLLLALVPLLSSAHERELLLPLLEKYLHLDFDEGQQVLTLLHINTLGGFSAQKGEERFDFHQVGQSSRLILALLLLAPQRALSTEVLMGQLWPDSSPVKARNNFDAAHSRLRKALEDVFGRVIRHHYLVLEKGMLSLQHTRVDVQQFAQHMENARYHLQREQYWQAEQLFWRMERLWQGEFLNGYDLGAGLHRYRDQFNQLRLEQLQSLAGLLTRRHDFQQAATLLRSGLLLDPTADALIRQLLAIYHQQGDGRSAEQLLMDYRTALQCEDYDAEEIDELIEAFGTHWFSTSKNYRQENRNHESL
jgi:DNA-binding response OmpR family regulator